MYPFSFIMARTILVIFEDFSMHSVFPMLSRLLIAESAFANGSFSDIVPPFVSAILVFVLRMMLFDYPQLYFLNPIFWAISLKHCLQRSRPYLSMCPRILPHLLHRFVLMPQLLFFGALCFSYFFSFRGL